MNQWRLTAPRWQQPL